MLNYNQTTLRQVGGKVKVYKIFLTLRILKYKLETSL